MAIDFDVIHAVEQTDALVPDRTQQVEPLNKIEQNPRLSEEAFFEKMRREFGVQLRDQGRPPMGLQTPASAPISTPQPKSRFPSLGFISGIVAIWVGIFAEGGLVDYYRSRRQARTLQEKSKSIRAQTSLQK